ncbi:MAG TPA: DUF6249 domain-containing protein [Vicinamibacterales bacterium]|jgi:hypothetical protein
MWDGTTVLPFLIPIIAIAGFFLVIALRISSAARVRELEIRERIAMIEKGIVPPPEVDPGGFEHALGDWRLSHRRNRPSRHRSAGITLMGIGVGLMFLIGFAGDAADQGIGVGGFIAIIGLAFFINSLFEPRRTWRDDLPPRSPQADPPAATSHSSLPPQ